MSPGDRGQGVELIPEEDLHPKYGDLNQNQISVLAIAKWIQFLVCRKPVSFNNVVGYRFSAESTWVLANRASAIDALFIDLKYTSNCGGCVR